MAEKLEKKVRVKILPLRGIGGYGDAGDEVMMPKSEADYYVQEGYVRILDKQDAAQPELAQPELAQPEPEDETQKEA